MKRFSSRFSAVFMSACMLVPAFSTGMAVNAESRSSAVMASKQNIEENAVMTVEITEIKGNTLIVKNSESPKQLITLSASYLENVKPVVGMKLEVTFSGILLETYPEQFDDVKKVTVINEKFDAEEFFVYVGTYGEGLPQFRYFYQKSDGSYTADKVIWENAPADISYGDVFVADGEISLTKVYPAADSPAYAMAYHYTIDESAVLNKAGSCADLMEKKDLTVTSTTYDGSAHWSIRYKDDADTEYYYGLSVFASSLEVDPLDCEIGDVYTFAIYNDYMVVPLEKQNMKENAVMTVEITEIKGNTLIVKNSESPKQLISLSASHLENVKPVVGMKLEVTFSGVFLETYPEQFADVKKVTVINEKFDAEEFFVYVGTYGEGLPQFRYFYQKSDGSYTADKVIWENAPADINYGDVFVADGEISLTKVYPAADNPVYAHACHYTIDEGAVLNKAGSCADLMEKKDLTVTSKTYDGSAHWSVRYKDDADTEYYYGLSVLASSLEVDPLDCEIGDVYTFALYNDYMVVPLEKQEVSESYGIGVSKLPDKTVYQLGEELDLSGLRLNGSYTMGELVACIMNEDYYELLESNVPIEVDTSMFDNTKAGTYSITVMYGNAKDSFTVDVLDTEPASGDVNNDGNFVLSDVVLLQKYLIDVPDTNFVNWQAADFCKDGRLDVFDLVLMKKAVIETLNI